MGQAPKTHETRNLIHILIGKKDKDPHVEFRAITKSLAELVILNANGNKELIENAISCCEAWQKMGRRKPSRHKGNAQYKSKGTGPEKSHRGKLQGQAGTLKAQATAYVSSWPKGRVKAHLPYLLVHGTCFRAPTYDEILARARKVL